MLWEELHNEKVIDKTLEDGSKLGSTTIFTLARAALQELRHELIAERLTVGETRVHFGG